MKYKTKVLIWGDLQAHQWQHLDEPSRWVDCLRAIRLVYEIACDPHNEIDSVIFLGDLFESKRTLRSDICSAVYSVLMEESLRFHLSVSNRIYAPNANPPNRSLASIKHNRGSAIGTYGHTIFLAGNHDYYNAGCTLSPFYRLPWCTSVYKEVEQAGLELYNSSKNVVYTIPILFIPFISSTDQQLNIVSNMATLYGKQRSTVGPTADYWAYAFSHCKIAGANMTKNVVDTQTTLADSILSYPHLGGNDRIIFNGHYHTPASLSGYRNVVELVGAPMQHSWSDMDTGDRGYAILEVEAEFKKAGDIVPAISNTFTRYCLDELPKFYSDKSNARKGVDFVLPEIDLDIDDDDYDFIRNTISLSDTYDPSKVLDEYVKSTGRKFKTTKEREHFIQYGVELFTKKEEEDHGKQTKEESGEQVLAPETDTE